MHAETQRIVLVAREMMPPEKDAQLLVRMTSEMLHALDAYSRAAPDLPKRPEAVRRLLIKALEGQGHRRPRKASGTGDTFLQTGKG